MEQKKERRYVAHLLYAPTSVRGEFNGQNVEIIEDLVPLRDTSVKLRVARAVKSVKLVPSGDVIDFSAKAGLVEFNVPEFTAHQMIELSY